jgi:hypothetical protein
VVVVRSPDERHRRSQVAREVPLDGGAFARTSVIAHTQSIGEIQICGSEPGEYARAKARASTEMFYDAEQDVGFQPVASDSFLKSVVEM